MDVFKNQKGKEKLTLKEYVYDVVHKVCSIFLRWKCCETK